MLDATSRIVNSRRPVFEVRVSAGRDMTASLVELGLGSALAQNVLYSAIRHDEDFVREEDAARREAIAEALSGRVQFVSECLSFDNRLDLVEVAGR